MKWVTRSNVKVDRVACPWLIRRFIDPQAVFLFVPEDQLLDTARKEKATPFDATRFPEVKLNHRGERCTFEAILDDYKLSDPALHRLALIVRGADVKVKGRSMSLQRVLDCAPLLRVLPFAESPTRSVWRGSFRSMTHCTSTFVTS